MKFTLKLIILFITFNLYADIEITFPENKKKISQVKKSTFSIFSRKNKKAPILKNTVP